MDWHVEGEWWVARDGQRQVCRLKWDWDVREYVSDGGVRLGKKWEDAKASAETIVLPAASDGKKRKR